MHLPPLPGPALTVCHYALSLSRSLPLSACSSLPVSLSLCPSGVDYNIKGLCRHGLPVMYTLSPCCSLPFSLCLSVSLSLSLSLLSLSVPQAWIITSKACAGMNHLSCTLSLSLASCMLLPACLSFSLCPSGVDYNIKGQLPSPYTPASVCLPIFSTVDIQ